MLLCLLTIQNCSKTSSPSKTAKSFKAILDLKTWSEESGLKFNETKCKTQCLTRKLTSVTYNYELNNKILIQTECEQDLGVFLDKNLTWKRQVNKQSAKANKLLGYIRRSTMYIHNQEVRRTLYLALVRPHLGYATQPWAPQSIELIRHLERMQRRATKYILHLPFSTTMSYSTRLQTLNLLPVCYWHEFLDMVLFYKIINDLISVHPTIRPTIRSSRPTRSSTSKNPKFVVPKCKTVTHQRSYIIRTTRIWSHLVDELNLNTDSFSSFKSSLFKYYESSLYLCYNDDDPRSYKTICPACNSVRSLTTSLSCCM